MYFKNKGKISLAIIFIFILLCLILSACESKEVKDEPEIRASFTISKLNNTDFDEIGTPDVEKEDFRKVKLKLEVSNSSIVSDRKIYIPDLKEIMNSYDNIDRYWYGSSISSDNIDEDAYYEMDYMFFSEGLDNEGIESVFHKGEIKVSWVNNDDEYVKHVINLTDIIEFKEAEEEEVEK